MLSLTSCEKMFDSATQLPEFEFKRVAKSQNSKLSSDILEYSYNENTKTLSFKHINAAFNSCAAISAKAQVVENKIFIHETEHKNICQTLSLFDLHYELTNLERDIYIISVKEPYINLSGKKIRFKIDLNQKSKGQLIIKRNIYPWGN